MNLRIKAAKFGMDISRLQGQGRCEAIQKPCAAHPELWCHLHVMDIYQNETPPTKKAAHKGGLFQEYFN
ncbi:hypothetical protein [Thalassospira sp. MIT1370]|uniref:hypothetical protein n=1 Tax=unclassified Thalassospira TaxID=2648997 RepID=UPI00399A2E9B